MKYTKKERLSIYRKMRKYIKKQFMYERMYLCTVLRYDISVEDNTKYFMSDFPELVALRPKYKHQSSPWWSDNGTTTEQNSFRLDAINKVIEEMTKSRTKKDISND